MLPSHALEFIVKHVAHKSISAIAQIAEVDAANLHACLAGKRNWPETMFRRVAAAVGLAGSHEKLILARGVVIYLEVTSNELPKLAEAIDSLAEHALWCLISAQGEPADGDVHAMTVASTNNGYIVISIRWDSFDSACQGVNGITELLPGCWINSDPDAVSLSQSGHQWIRLRAGIEPLSTFDGWFNKGEPRIEDWVEMLLEVSRDGLRPEQITRIVKSSQNKIFGRNRSVKKSLE